ncbi:hypothetical protein FGRMN_7366 [Fusarium graminum]|nr:hypothetical protein FGRMN_7366 [Fusarium graminum]
MGARPGGTNQPSSSECEGAGKSMAEACLVGPGILEAVGISCDELVGDLIQIPNRATISIFEQGQRIIDVIRILAGNDILDDECLDRVIMTLTYGAVRDYSTQKLAPPNMATLPSLQDWREKLRQWLDGTLAKEEGTTDYVKTDSAFIGGLRDFTANGWSKTLGGSFARVPPTARSGDIVAVLLGLDTTILLRPQASPNTFSVIGPCYHAKFAYGQGLLGNDFHGWERLWDNTMFLNTFHKEGEGLRRTDPRLDGVPLDDGFEQVIPDDALRYGDGRIQKTGVKALEARIRACREIP